MNKIRTISIVAFLSATALTSVNAAPVCNQLTNSTGGTSIDAYIQQVACNTAPSITKLIASNQFPDVSYLGLCYILASPINVKLGNMRLTIQSVASAWTNSSDTLGLPNILGGSGTVGTVATSFTVSNANSNSAQFFTRDTINLGEDPATAGNEYNVITGGTNFLAGAKGTINFGTQLLLLPSFPPPSPPQLGVRIVTIGGTICTTNQNQQ